MANYSKSKNKNTTFGGEAGVTIPNGATAARGADVLGKLRYNTSSGLPEFFTANGWAAVAPPPVVSSISGIINEDTDSTITVTGSNFSSDAIVYIEGAAVSGTPRALVTTFVSSTELTAATNASSVGYIGAQSFNVKVTNGSGLSSVLEPAGTIDRDPVWSTAAGSLGTFYDRQDLPGAETYQYTSGATTYQVIKFLSPATYTWTSPVSGTVDVLVVGGGGAGGGNLGGGGGAGGVIETTASVSAGTNYTITVGRGGYPIVAGQNGVTGTSYNNGTSSSAFGNTAVGGGAGGGGSSSVAAQSGGSGGGASGYGTSSGGSGTSGQGTSGGSGGGGSPAYPGGGGGGAGGSGSAGSNSTGAGAGGPGIVSGITGLNLYYGGGGGGGAYTSLSGGNGGIGGGGGGASNNANPGSGGGTAENSGKPGAPFYQVFSGHLGQGGTGGGNAGENTGGGGGGASHQTFASGAGGSGIVVIRYDAALGTGSGIISVSASDPDGTSVSYSLASGTLPAGTALSGNSISGYLADVASNTNYSFSLNATSNGQSETRAFSATVAPTPERILVAALTDAGSSTVTSPDLVTWDNISESSTGGVVMVDKNNYPFWNDWTYVTFTSKNKPGVRWRFRRDSIIENIVTCFMRPYSSWPLSVNGGYAVTPAPGSTNWTNVQGKMQFQHNNAGGEKLDVPTLGYVGGSVWATGMLWGNIDSPGNYGGLLNTPYAAVGPGGGNTGDTLLVYLETGDVDASDYTNYLTPSGPLGDARSFSWSYNNASGLGGSPSHLADAIDRGTTSSWTSYGFQHNGNDSYIQVDLGSAVAFDYTYVIGYPGGSHMSNQNLIQASNDASNWYTICEWSYHPGQHEDYGGYLYWNAYGGAGYNYSRILTRPDFWIPMDQNLNRTAYRYYRLRGTNFSSTNNYQLVFNWALLKK